MFECKLNQPRVRRIEKPFSFIDFFGVIISVIMSNHKLEQHRIWIRSLYDHFAFHIVEIIYTR